MSHGYPTEKLLRVVRRPTGGGGWWYDYQYEKAKTMYMCPHCGWKYDPQVEAKRRKSFNFQLVPTHDFPKLCRAICPGAGQVPRNADSDKRPLWKDEQPAQDSDATCGAR